MSFPAPSEPKFEIGHVLFIDIVGYSKLLINEQSDQLQKLKETVRGSEQVRLAEAEGKLLRLPTGDGGALVFRNNPEAPVLCALEVSRALQSYPDLRVRMGIHSGPVNEVSDLNEQANIAGAGVNFAQRVMDCGDAGHILLSKHVADDLKHYPRWQPFLHELGDCEVKHGVRIGLVSFHGDGVGNPALPGRLRVLKRHRAKQRFAMIMAALLALSAIVTGVALYSRGGRSTIAAPDKSIAVLPFENLSHDPENAYFAEGIQDEIITRLANLRELKVISRTSTAKYKSRPDNLKTIAGELRVASILEGSVQKLANDVHINVQLIRAADDTHLWAQSYDRTLAHAFAVQGEVAQTVADALKVTLVPAQIEQLKALPTQNVQAYDFFLKGEYELHSAWADAEKSEQRAHTAVGYYQEAIRLDPNFAAAYASLARAQLSEFYVSVDRSDEKRRVLGAAAKASIDRALSLLPDLTVAHLALAEWYLWINYDHSSAIKELDRVIELDPHLSDAYLRLAGVWKRENMVDKAIAAIQPALAFDPRNIFIHRNLAGAYMATRQYSLAVQSFSRAISLDPTDTVDVGNLVGVYACLGDMPAAFRTAESLPPIAASYQKWSLLYLQRDFRGLEKLLKEAPAEAWPERWMRALREGQIAGGLGQAEIARARLEEARAGAAGTLEKDSGAGRYAALGYIDARLGRAEEAIAEGKRGVELASQNHDLEAVGGALTALATIYSLLGRTDDAIEVLDQLFATPAGIYISVSDLKLDPDWDPIRNDPRFQKLCQEKRQ